MTRARCSRLALAAAVHLPASAELASQHLPASGELGWRVPEAKSPRRALVLSAAGTLLPVALGAVVLATRPRGDPVSGKPADETYDVVGGALIGLGLGAGPSLGHFYAHEMGWFLPRILVGGVLGLVAASSDLGDGVALALLGGTAVTIMAARDIATAPAAARRYNERRLGLAVGLDLPRGERQLGLRFGLALKL